MNQINRKHSTSKQKSLLKKSSKMYTNKLKQFYKQTPRIGIPLFKLGVLVGLFSLSLALVVTSFIKKVPVKVHQNVPVKMQNLVI